jgi:hypothetical protein
MLKFKANIKAHVTEDKKNISVYFKCNDME